MGEINLPSAAECLASAHRALLDGQIDAADTWIYLAKELREGSRPPRPFVLGDNVPDEVASAIAQLSGEVETWKARAHAMRAEVARWQGAAESYAEQLTGIAARGGTPERKAEPVQDVLNDDLPFGRTYAGEPAYPVSAPVFADAARAAGMSTAQLDADALRQAVTEAMQVVDPLPDLAEANRRLRLNDTKLAVPAERPTSPLPVLKAGTCDDCGSETYEAVTATGTETRHRRTGTAFCPVER